MPNEKKVWTKEEDEVLINGVSSKTNAELVSELGCCNNTINKRFKELHIWSDRLEFSRKRSGGNINKGNFGRELRINHFKRPKSYFVTRVTDDSKSKFLSNLKSMYKYDVRRKSKIVFITPTTKTSWRMERRLRNEFPDWTLKDLRHLSTIKQANENNN